MKSLSLCRSGFRACTIVLGLSISVASWADMSPVQTTQAWLSAVKRNDTNAMMLLAFTPEENLRHRRSYQAECALPKTVYDELGGSTEAVTAHLVELTTPKLGEYNDDAQQIVLAAGELLSALPSDRETNDKDRQELQLALQAWSARADFQDPQRWKKSISTLVFHWEKLNDGIENCTNESGKTYFKRLGTS
jgi:hypothetical protein